jgi:hypothetical protein
VDQLCLCGGRGGGTGRGEKKGEHRAPPPAREQDGESPAREQDEQQLKLACPSVDGVGDEGLVSETVSLSPRPRGDSARCERAEGSQATKKQTLLSFSQSQVREGVL